MMIEGSIPANPRGASTRREMIAGVAAAALGGLAAGTNVWAHAG